MIESKVRPFRTHSHMQREVKQKFDQQLRARQTDLDIFDLWTGLKYFPDHK